MRQAVRLFLFHMEPTSVTNRFMQAAVVAVGLLAVVQPAAAQQGWQDRVFAGINFGYETGESSFNTTGSSRVYGETATITNDGMFGAGPVLDATIGARVLGNIGVSVTYTRQRATADNTVSGSIPHPLLFNRARTFSQTQTDFTRTETGLHLSVGYMVPLSNRFDVYLYGGPSSFRLNQDTVSEVAIAEIGAPFTSITVTPKTSVAKKSSTGYHAGFDATYRLVDTGGLSVGLGGFFRYTSATASVMVAGASIETTLGGPQFGGGLRFRF